MASASAPESVESNPWNFENCAQVYLEAQRRLDAAARTATKLRRGDSRAGDQTLFPGHNCCAVCANEQRTVQPPVRGPAMEKLPEVAVEPADDAADSLLVCATCRGVAYCCPEHASMDASVHSKVCEVIQQCKVDDVAADEAAAAPGPTRTQCRYLSARLAGESSGVPSSVIRPRSGL